MRAEAASLQRLAEADLPAQLEVPRLLHLGSWEGATVVGDDALWTPPSCNGPAASSTYPRWR